MIDHISIRDFAIIDNVEVDFGEGLSVITGETGSGKSILVTAISLALGSRADTSYVRNGKEKAVVELAATLPKRGSGDIQRSNKSIDSQEDEMEEVVIVREINTSGKNLCKLNGETVTLSQLAAKCREIADIHGQYDNQSILDPDTHIEILDRFGEQAISPIKEDYLRKYQDYVESKRALKELLALESENAKKLDFYKFQIEEIERANPRIGEDEELRNRLSLLQNSEKIFESAKEAYSNINGDGLRSEGAFSSLGTAVSNLENIAEYSDEINKILIEARELYYRLEDVTYSMRDVMDSLTFDPEEIDSIIERLNVLDSLRKKYDDGKSTGNSWIENVLLYKERISGELFKIENYDDEKKRLSDRYKASKLEVLDAGAKLTAERKKAAEELRKKILIELEDLNFEDADLLIELRPLSSETNKEIEPGENGLETAEILITTNRGEPLKPLVKTSSGGEISRIMLAIKNITAEYDNVPTLIFDEIDQGISGKTAAIVGRKLEEISRSHQVICITHLPQIAARGRSAYRIFKESDDSKTYTHVEKLNDEMRVQEVARLLGGEEITKTALDNARELIAKSSS